MTDLLGCEQSQSGLVERYSAGTLTEQETEAFEAHFLTCDQCQADLVLAAGIRTALSRSAAPVALRRRWPAWATGIGLAAAAGLAGIWLVTSRTHTNGLAHLGEVVQAPVYLGIPVRGGPSAAADSLFDAAMTEYTQEHYASAADGLQAALAAGVDPPAAEFFLASSALMTGRPALAADHFATVTALGDTPYLGEAHFYRAKALLRLGQSSAALEELARAAALGGVTASAARALQDSVKGAIRR